MPKEEAEAAPKVQSRFKAKILNRSSAAAARKKDVGDNKQNKD
jgi:hypothetical protein